MGEGPSTGDQGESVPRLPEELHRANVEDKQALQKLSNSASAGDTGIQVDSGSPKY